MDRFKEVNAKFLNYEIDSSWVRLSWVYDVHGHTFSDSANVYMNIAKPREAQMLFNIAFECAKNGKGITVLYSNDIPVGIKNDPNAEFVTWLREFGRTRIDEYRRKKK